ncbi:hypothetical protein [Aeromicrobium sp. HA]|uniref:hypothetical protein n=1 Tax=Aeromicrobium sp. HA TaxID=3009077 RepID=UPI0022B05B66|nr:hypothetical protein [Aeromicrobium sp. HA]
MQLMSFYHEEPIKAKESSVLQLPFDRAREFTFGNEPTIAKVVYVSHPRIATRVVPYGQYDSLVMTDKFNEALRIVQTLGAHKVVTRSFRGNLSRLSIKGKLPQGSAASEISKSTSDEIAFEQVGTGGPPVDPGESVYPDEAGFEAARRAVLLNGARHVAINIESQSAFRVDSDVATALKKFGFTLGANGEKAQVRLLRLDAYFPEKGKLHSPDLSRLSPLFDPRPALDPDAPSSTSKWLKFGK